MRAVSCAFISAPFVLCRIVRSPSSHRPGLARRLAQRLPAPQPRLPALGGKPSSPLQSHNYLTSGPRSRHTPPSFRTADGNPRPRSVCRSVVSLPQPCSSAFRGVRPSAIGAGKRLRVTRAGHVSSRALTAHRKAHRKWGAEITNRPHALGELALHLPRNSPTPVSVITSSLWASTAVDKFRRLPNRTIPKGPRPGRIGKCTSRPTS